MPDCSTGPRAGLLQWLLRTSFDSRRAAKEARFGNRPGKPLWAGTRPSLPWQKPNDSGKGGVSAAKRRSARTAISHKLQPPPFGECGVRLVMHGGTVRSANASALRPAVPVAILSRGHSEQLMSWVNCRVVGQLPGGSELSDPLQGVTRGVARRLADPGGDGLSGCSARRGDSASAPGSGAAPPGPDAASRGTPWCPPHLRPRGPSSGQ